MSKLFVQSVGPTFRRAGRAFTSAATELDPATLSFGELHSLVVEPQLVVRAEVDHNGEPRGIGPLELRNAICEAHGDDGFRTSVIREVFGLLDDAPTQKGEAPAFSTVPSVAAASAAASVAQPTEEPPRDNTLAEAYAAIGEQRSGAEVAAVAHQPTNATAAHKPASKGRK